MTLVFVLLFAGTAFGLGYEKLSQAHNAQDISELLESHRVTPSGSTETSPDDPNSGRAVNILVVGSDSREGDNDVDGAGASGTTAGMRSDTTLIAHVSADRRHVEIVSIPRDALVDIPSCPLPDGTTTYAQSNTMFNAAFATGAQTGDVAYGAACTILTVEQLTGLTIDDFVVVDFTGFTRVINALDGVPIYFEEDVSDSASGLNQVAGCHLLDGDQALAYARTRKALGDGSDISRIGRQQYLIKSVVNEALSASLLTNPTRTYDFLEASVSTLTTGTSLFGSLWGMAGFAMSLSSISGDNITMVTMPFDWAGARVTVNSTYAPQVWEALANDSPVDPLLTGAGWEISQNIAARDAAAEAATSASTPSVTAGTEGTTSDSTAGAAPESAGISDAQDPASQCTRETAW